LAGIMSNDGSTSRDDTSPAHAHVSTPGTDGHSDVVVLDLPLHHRHASTVRVVAASLAADLGFSVDEIEDLRLGVDEAVSVMADVEADAEARLHLRFESADSSITVRITRSSVERPITADEVDGLAVRILTAVVDRFEVSDGSFIVSKRAAGTHVD
jgi:serine/threonine-protein kinase RsbW